VVARPKLLWVGDIPAPANVRQAARDRWDLASSPFGRELRGQVGDTSVAVVCPTELEGDQGRIQSLLEELSEVSTVAVLLLPGDASEAWSVAAGEFSNIICAREDSPAGELAARLEAASQLQPAIAKLRRELTQARDAAAGATRTIEEVDEEMRLAGKLQREFLPNRMPEVGPIRFGTLFRPASWVSGDIYDVIRLDETHVGFYVIDAVGHGMPAALLTMFIKKALQTKRIVGNSYQIVPPRVAMAELNADICEQDLASCQFCTAAYCVVDTDTLTLTYSRAGHPEPLLIRPDGCVQALPCPGSLLGIFPGEKYHSRQVRLAPGDRLVVYSDGAEDALCGIGGTSRPTMAEVVAPWATMAREELLLQLTAAIDASPEDEACSDDITVLVMDVQPD
jgi:phosphoserine phosphatase RsbU/P